jgi:hypothetical protein
MKHDLGAFAVAASLLPDLGSPLGRAIWFGFPGPRLSQNQRPNSRITWSWWARQAASLEGNPRIRSQACLSRGLAAMASHAASRQAKSSLSAAQPLAFPSPPDVMFGSIATSLVESFGDTPEIATDWPIWSREGFSQNRPRCGSSGGPPPRHRSLENTGRSTRLRRMSHFCLGRHVAHRLGTTKMVACLDDAGKGAQDFQCVYHAWRYDLRGNLQSVATSIRSSPGPCSKPWSWAPGSRASGCRRLPRIRLWLWRQGRRGT